MLLAEGLLASAAAVESAFPTDDAFPAGKVIPANAEICGHSGLADLVVRGIKFKPRENANNAPLEESCATVGSPTKGSEVASSTYIRRINDSTQISRSYRLYFIMGSNELTPESKIVYRAILDDINTNRQADVTISIIGHADYVEQKKNASISALRAYAIARALRDDGVLPRQVFVIGVGFKDPLFETSEAELRNRFVEVIVRH